MGVLARYREHLPLTERTPDVDLNEGQLRVMGKGGRGRVLPIGRKAIRGLDRYLRARAKHPHADLPWLWLARKGRLTTWGVTQAIERRGQQAGMRIHPHLFRHTFAHMWLAGEGTTDDLMKLAGRK